MTNKICVVRHTNGIALNTLGEVLQDDAGNVLWFESVFAALDHLQPDNYEEVEFLYQYDGKNKEKFLVTEKEFKDWMGKRVS